MANPSNSRSLTEPPARQSIGGLAEQRLSARLTPPQGVEPDATGVEIDLGGDQPVRPRCIDLEPTAQQLHGPVLAGPPQVDEPTTRVGLQVQLPPLGERPSGWGRLDPRRGPRSG